MKLELTDGEARNLIKILKLLLKKYDVPLGQGNKGDIELESIEKDSFILSYFISKYRGDKISIHLREKHTNLNLVRINIDPVGFHKNANGELIKGNRILIFSTEEWFKKNDGYTHVRAYDVPKEFTDTSNLEQVFLDFLLYINVKEEEKLTFYYSFEESW